MLIELYIEALLADEELADAVWYLCDGDVIDNDMAAVLWSRIALARLGASEPQNLLSNDLGEYLSERARCKALMPAATANRAINSVLDGRVILRLKP